MHKVKFRYLTAFLLFFAMSEGNKQVNQSILQLLFVTFIKFDLQFLDYKLRKYFLYPMHTIFEFQDSVNVRKYQLKKYITISKIMMAC